MRLWYSILRFWFRVWYTMMDYCWSMSKWRKSRCDSKWTRCGDSIGISHCKFRFIFRRMGESMVDNFRSMGWSIS